MGSRSIRISEKAGRILQAYLRAYEGTVSPLGDVQREVERALQPKRYVQLAAKRKARAKRSKREETSAIYEKVLARSEFRCEACHRQFWLYDPGELDHFFGRRGPQSERTCWVLHRECHRQKTENLPSAEVWLKQFLAHCVCHGYAEEASRARRRLEALELVEQAKSISGGGK